MTLNIDKIVRSISEEHKCVYSLKNNPLKTQMLNEVQCIVGVGWVQHQEGLMRSAERIQGSGVILRL